MPYTQMILLCVYKDHRSKARACPSRKVTEVLPVYNPNRRRFVAMMAYLIKAVSFTYEKRSVSLPYQRILGLEGDSACSLRALMPQMRSQSLLCTNRFLYMRTS